LLIFLVAIARHTTRQNQPVQNDGAVASTSSSAAPQNRPFVVQPSDPSDWLDNYDALTPPPVVDDFGEVLVHNSPPPTLTRPAICEELFIPTSDEDIEMQLPVHWLHRTEATVQCLTR
jgi:hypothetical protein